MRNRLPFRRARNPAEAEGRRSDDASSRASRAHAIAVECLRRRMAGEVVSDVALLSDHADLEPELSAALAHLQTVEQALFHAQPPASSVTGEHDHAPQPGASTTSSQDRRRNYLSVRCPHCHTPSGVPSAGAWNDLTCSACGSHFSLVDLDSSGSGQTVMTTVGHFELVEPLGVGGFGAVWKALDKELDRWVAIKIPRGDRLSPDQAEQFFREARAAAELRHPNIVSVHAVGRDQGKLYIVSDYVAGGSLAEWIADQRMTCREAATLCQKIALALAHAHAAGVVHRDLKPANILLSVDGEPYLTDFGLARRDLGETTVTLDGQLLGTPAYMSPEQARGDAHGADHRADIYSLGVILYELLTGELPFRGSTGMLLKQILEDEPPNPRSLNGGVPRDLATIGLKCLDKDPGRRYATAQDLAVDMGRFLRGEPIVARPVSRAERTWRWCRRRPVVAALTAAVSVLLVTVAAVTTYSSISSQAAAKEALWQHYLSDMHVAMQAWEEGNPSRAIELLDRHRPADGEEDLRRFEWHYLWRQCRFGSLATILPQDGRVSCLAVSRNGQWLAVTQNDQDGTIEVWHLPSSRKRYTLKGGSGSAWVESVAFSPDSQMLVSGSLGGDVMLWDMATGSLRQKLASLDDMVWGVSFSPNGKLIAAATTLRTVRLWDAYTLAPIDVFTIDDTTARFYRLAFSPDSRMLAVGCTDQTTKLWDLDTRSLNRSFVGHTGTVVHLAFAPDGTILATASADHTVKLWNANDGALLRTLSGHTAMVRWVAFSPHGSAIATASNDGTVRVWKTDTGEQVDVLRGHSGWVRSVSYSPDGRSLITGGIDTTVRVWDLNADRGTNILRGHVDGVWGLDVHPNGQTIASGGEDGTVRLWSLHDGRLLQTQTLSSKKGTNAVAFSPSGQTLAVGDSGGDIELWSDEKSEPVLLRGHAGAIGGLAWSQDEETLAAGDSAGGVILWDIDARTPRLKLPGHHRGVWSVAYSPDGRTFVTRCEDGKLRIWDPQTGQLRLTIDEPAYFYCPVAFSRDGRVLASGSVDLSIRFWDTSTWTLLCSLRGHTDRVKSLAFSLDGRTLASGCDDGQIKLWEVATGEERCTLRAYTREVEAVRFTPDGETLVSVGQTGPDGTVRVWRTRD